MRNSRKLIKRYTFLMIDFHITFVIRLIISKYTRCARNKIKYNYYSYVTLLNVQHHFQNRTT